MSWMCKQDKKIKVIFYLWIILPFLWTAPSFAGKYAADFLRIGVGARPLAMGGAYVAAANDGSAFYWNPAGLPSLHKVSLQFDHVPMFGGLAQYNAANVTIGLNPRMAIGLSWIRLGVDDIPRYAPLRGSSYDRLTRNQYRSTGEGEGYFSDMEDALMVSFCRSFLFDMFFGSVISDNRVPMEISFGFTGKYIHQQLDANRGSGQGLDAGVMLRFLSDQSTAGEPNTWLGFGVLARDLSRTEIVWNTSSNHKDQVETAVQAGVAFSKLAKIFHTRITLSLDQEFGFYKELYAGGELSFFNTLALRGGFYNKNFSAGAGLSFLGFTIDYAFIANELANTHRLSGSFHF